MIDFNTETVVISQIAQVDHMDKIDVLLTVNGKLFRMPMSRFIKHMAKD